MNLGVRPRDVRAGRCAVGDRAYLARLPRERRGRRAGRCPPAGESLGRRFAQLRGQKEAGRLNMAERNGADQAISQRTRSTGRKGKRVPTSS